jgi:hypothetical protein
MAQGGMAQGGAMTAGGMGGAVMDPFAHCMVPPLLDVTTCSFEQACETLDCGGPWALHQEDGCRRTTCVADGDCAAGQRCIPAPVGGVFDDWLTSGCETCDIVAGECVCACHEGSGLVAVCLDLGDYPPSSDCPIDGLPCEELHRVGLIVERYLDDGFAEGARTLLESCWNKIFARHNDECLGGQGGAGGEGGSG